MTITAIPSTLGIDIETDAAVLLRIQSKMQSPPKGGASADFRFWAESISGVFRAYNYPLRGGIGTTHTIITGPGSGTKRAPTATVQTSVNNYTTGTGSTNTGGQRSITAQGYTTLLPYMPAYATGPGNIGGLTLRCRLVPAKSKYKFDWIDTAASYTVAAWNSSTNVLTFTQVLPASLTAAIDAGNSPRIQVLSTGANAPAVPIQLTATAYNAGAKTVTVNAPSSTWVAPNALDAIYAGGTTVAQTAAAILAYIDGLGPSRVGGYAEAVSDYWEDTAAIDRIKQICLDQVDTDSARFFSNTLTSASPGPVTIANGSNAAAIVDIQASDGTVNGPEILYARFIAVTQ